MSKRFSSDELQLTEQLTYLRYLRRKYSEAFRALEDNEPSDPTGKLNGEVHRYRELVMREERKRYLSCCFPRSVATT
jgi:hypothetical protein